MNEESEAPVRKLSGIPGWAAWTLAVGLSVYALVWVVTIVQPQIYRVSFLLIALVLDLSSLSCASRDKSSMSSTG